MKQWMRMTAGLGLLLALPWAQGRARSSPRPAVILIHCFITDLLARHSGRFVVRASV